MSGEQAASPVPLARLVPERVLRGPAYGVGQPVLVIRLETRPGMTRAEEVCSRLADLFGPPPEALAAEGQRGPEAAAAAHLLAGAMALQERADLPLFEPGRLLRVEKGGAGGGTVRMAAAYPPGTPQAAEAAIAWVARAINAGGAAPVGGSLAAGAAAQVADLGRLAPRQGNTRRLLAAVHARGLACLPLGGEVYQAGLGRASRWLESTLTDRTPDLGAWLAGDKARAGRRLGEVGLPVAEQALPDSEESAVAAAETMGFPVVVKPADLEGGRAVAAGLRQPEGVRRAFREARSLSRRVLVEKHVAGRDYRLLVMEGELIWAVQRRPGGVRGDGERTVAELIEAVNADPRRGPHATAPLKPLAWDREAEELAGEVGLHGGSVPNRGEFVRLRRASNVASGGTPEGVLDRVHPDNRRLAQQAADAFRLDLAGVDVLMPDIGRSWLETGAHICEVNAQPTLGAITHPGIYGEIVARLMAGGDQPPVAVIVGGGAADETARCLHRAWGRQGWRAGLATSEGAWLGEERIMGPGASSYEAAWALAISPEAEAMALAVAPASVGATGLPMPAFDVLVLPVSEGDGPDTVGEFAHALEALLPHSRQGLVLDGSDATFRRWGSRIHDQPVVRLVGEPLGRHQAHEREKGGQVWLERARDGWWVYLAEAHGPATPLRLDGSLAEDRARSVALAAAAARPLGLDPEALLAATAASAGER